MSARGIPTIHKSRRYRSRLEAKWAAFFDLLGWHAEYEPFDCDGWIPDFAITTSTGFVLVEVKPITMPSPDIYEKIDVANTDCYGVLLVGLSPFESRQDGASPGSAAIGWYSPSPKSGWIESNLAVRKPLFDFYSRSGGGIRLHVIGRDQRAHDEEGAFLTSHIVPATTIWSNACNSVQWRRT